MSLSFISRYSDQLAVTGIMLIIFIKYYRAGDLTANTPRFILLIIVYGTRINYFKF